MAKTLPRLPGEWYACGHTGADGSRMKMLRQALPFVEIPALGLAMGMDRSGVLRGFVLCIWVRRILVQRLGWAMVSCMRKRRAGKDKHQKGRGEQLLHAINLALGRRGFEIQKLTRMKQYQK